MIFNMKLITSYLVLGFFSVQAVLGGEVLESIQTKGSGITERDAVKDALVNAVSQYNGLSIDSTVGMQTAQAEITQQFNDAFVTTGKMESSYQSTTLQKTKGRIRSYEVISSEQETDKSWSVLLSVAFAKYKTPGLSPDGRRKIVMAPFASDYEAFRLGTGQVPVKTIQNDLDDKLNTYFTQSRRFAVLTRKDAESILAEKRLILTSSDDIGEQAKIGAALGTDYILAGSIGDLYIGYEEKTIQLTGAVVPKVIRARIKVAYRIVVMATTQVKWSDAVVIDLPKAELDAFAGDVASAYDYLIDYAARTIASACLNNIYPVKGVRVQEDGTVVLDQGGAMMSAGQLFNAFVLGEMDYSPTTKEPLGRDEKWAATLQLVTVEAKKSTAKVVKGRLTADDIKQGVVCRYAAPEPEPETAKPDKTSGRGVVLPFD